MTPEMELLKDLKKRIVRIEKSLVKAADDKDWIAAKDVKKDYGYSVETLSKFRKSGKLKKFRCSDTGRNFHYSHKELQTLFITSN